MSIPACGASIVKMGQLAKWDNLQLIYLFSNTLFSLLYCVQGELMHLEWYQVVIQETDDSVQFSESVPFLTTLNF